MADYITKVNKMMMMENIFPGNYTETVKNTLQDLNHFQNFLYRHFCETEDCYIMHTFF